jgi:hypothetical protein
MTNHDSFLCQLFLSLSYPSNHPPTNTSITWSLLYPHFLDCNFAQPSADSNESRETVKLLWMDQFIFVYFHRCELSVDQIFLTVRIGSRHIYCLRLPATLPWLSSFNPLQLMQSLQLNSFKVAISLRARTVILHKWQLQFPNGEKGDCCTCLATKN